MSALTGASTGKSGWREPILNYFSSDVASFARLTIAADPDGLLTEQDLVQEIQCRGFDLIPFDDAIAFRYAYESRFRAVWDRRDETTLVVVLRALRSDVEALPFDLLHEAKRHSRLLSFGISELFPNLAPHVLLDLDRADLDPLYQAQQTYDPGQLGENATRDFVLRHVFELAPELIKRPSDLLRVLLRRHYGARVVPGSLDARFIQRLQQSGAFADWPLDQIVPSRGAFFSFLQERWPVFLRSRQSPDGGLASKVKEPENRYYAGPEILPFHSPDVRVYIDNLFVEGLLEPVAMLLEEAPAEQWIRAGILVEEEPARSRQRLDKLGATLESSIPEESAGYREWIAFAFRWATWLGLRFDPDVTGSSAIETPAGDAIDLEPLDRLHNEVERRFRAWMTARYAALHNLSYLPKPVMVHQIPHYLGHLRSQSAEAIGDRIALLVIDGLALDQWAILKEALHGFRFEEDGAFAWVPTLTQITRQSIFVGEPPMFFAKTIRGTFAEGSHWTRLWADKGLSRHEVFYVAPQGKKEETEEVEKALLEAADHPRCRILGGVVGTIDQNMHQTDLGTDGMHSMVRHWARTGRLQAIIAALLERDFAVFLTADHGNVFGRGIGKPNVGAAAKQRGERAHIFESELIRTSVHEQYPGSLEWPQIGLPPDLWALIAPVRACFLPEGKAAVSHGGISLEEVIVPFVRVSVA